MTGIVEQIAITPDRAALPAPVMRVRAEAGRGIEGEYHWSPEPDPGQSITLIAAEALTGLREDTGIELSHEASRRNVLTRASTSTRSSAAASASARSSGRASSCASRATRSRS